MKSVTKCDILYPIKTLWDELVQNHGQHTAGIRFRTYLRYYVPDHRPLWVEFSTQQWAASSAQGAYGSKPGG